MTLVLAPAEPTKEMLDAACEVGPDTNSGCFSYDDARSVYRAMIEARPPPPRPRARSMTRRAKAAGVEVIEVPPTPETTP